MFKRKLSDVAERSLVPFSMLVTGGAIWLPKFVEYIMGVRKSSGSLVLLG